MTIPMMMLIIDWSGVGFLAINWLVSNIQLGDHISILPRAELHIE